MMNPKEIIELAKGHLITARDAVKDLDDLNDELAGAIKDARDVLGEVKRYDEKPSDDQVTEFNDEIKDALRYIDKIQAAIQKITSGLVNGRMAVHEACDRMHNDGWVTLDKIPNGRLCYTREGLTLFKTCILNEDGSPVCYIKDTGMPTNFLNWQALEVHLLEY